MVTAPESPDRESGPRRRFWSIFAIVDEISPEIYYQLFNFECITSMNYTSYLIFKRIIEYYKAERTRLRQKSRINWTYDRIATSTKTSFRQTVVTDFGSVGVNLFERCSWFFGYSLRRILIQIIQDTIGYYQYYRGVHRKHWSDVVETTGRCPLPLACDSVGLDS